MLTQRPGSARGRVRRLAAGLGMSEAALGRELRVSYAKVAEFQKRGVVHFHAIIRLDGADDPIRAALRDLRRLARKIRDLRFRNGALDYALPEVHCDLDAQGNPVGFSKRGSTEAYGEGGEGRAPPPSNGTWPRP